MNINEEAIKALDQMNILSQKARIIGSSVFSGEGNEESFNDLRQLAEDIRSQINIWESEIPIQK